MVSIHTEGDLYYRQKGVPKPGLMAQRQTPSVHNTYLVCVHVRVCTEGDQIQIKQYTPVIPALRT